MSRLNKKEIKIDTIKKSFALIDDDVFRKTKNGMKRINPKANSYGYMPVHCDGIGIAYYHRIYWALHSNSDVPCDMEVDHIDGDKSNNHWWNLRLVSMRENCQNKERNRNGRKCGTNFDKRENKWLARIFIKGKQIRLGMFDSEEEASIVYKTAEIKAYLYDGDNKKFRAECGYNYNPKGFSFCKKRKKYQVGISIKNKRVNLGLFNKESEALEAYEKAVANRDLYSGNNSEFRDLVREGNQ
jgi:hypothetical protein